MSFLLLATRRQSENAVIRMCNGKNFSFTQIISKSGDMALLSDVKLRILIHEITEKVRRIHQENNINNISPWPNHQTFSVKHWDLLFKQFLTVWPRPHCLTGRTCLEIFWKMSKILCLLYKQKIVWWATFAMWPSDQKLLRQAICLTNNVWSFSQGKTHNHNL